MTLSRMVALEREQIGLLKALGFGQVTIAGHYIKIVLAITVVGIGIGFAAGIWLGQGLTRLYGAFFHFPFLIFRHDADVYAVAGLVTVLAAIAGALKAVREVLALAPAIAMQPPAPTRYRRLFWKERAPLFQASRLTVMALRHIVRRPLRAAATALGIAMAVGLLVTALLSFDSVEQMVDIAFFRTDRQHATLTFTDEKSPRALQAVERLPGVLRAEPYRSVAVRLSNGHLSRQTSIIGKPREMDLSRVLDLAFELVRLPASGLVINERVAQMLRLRRGDLVEVAILEGRRGTERVPVTDIIKSYFGLVAFMDLDALDQLMQGPRLTGVHIAYDANSQNDLFAAIKATPAIGAIGLQRHALARFRETIAQNINYSVTIYVALAVIIAVGVVYNSARIQLSEHARELASLRVLGFTRGEVSRVLLTELALLTLAAIPLGWIIGYAFGWLLIQAFTSDLYRVPFVIERATYGKASLVVLLAAAASALIVRRRVDRLDLIGVLKTRD
jgi:putative ABC transport system permease protein